MGWVTIYERDPETGKLARLPADVRPRPGSERRYRAQWRGPTGKIGSKMCRRSHEAEALIRKMEAARDVGTYFDPALGRQPFGDLLEHVLATASHLRPSTLQLYRSQARLYLGPALGARPVSSIDTPAVREFVADLRARTGAGQTSSTFRLLRRVLQVAVDDGLIARNPARGVRPPVPPAREIRFLTGEEVALIAAEVNPRYRALVLLLGWRGPRFGEAAGLRVKDVDLFRGRLRIERALSVVGGQLLEGPTKTKRARSLRLPASLRDELTVHLERFSDPRDPEAPVFTNTLGHQLRHNSFRRQIFHPACDRIGISPRPRLHDLRHTAVALAIAAGAHAKEIQEMCGHSSMAITFDVYGHLFDSVQDASVERLDLLLRESQSPPPSEVRSLEG